jgi:hypothetical protein
LVIPILPSIRSCHIPTGEKERCHSLSKKDAELQECSFVHGLAAASESTPNGKLRGEATIEIVSAAGRRGRAFGGGD